MVSKTDTVERLRTFTPDEREKLSRGPRAQTPGLGVDKSDKTRDVYVDGVAATELRRLLAEGKTTPGAIPAPPKTPALTREQARQAMQRLGYLRSDGRPTDVEKWCDNPSAIDLAIAAGVQTELVYELERVPNSLLAKDERLVEAATYELERTRFLPAVRRSPVVQAAYLRTMPFQILQAQYTPDLIAGVVASPLVAKAMRDVDPAMYKRIRDNSPPDAIARNATFTDNLDDCQALFRGDPIAALSMAGLEKHPRLLIDVYANADKAPNAALGNTAALNAWARLDAVAAREFFGKLERFEIEGVASRVVLANCAPYIDYLVATGLKDRLADLARVPNSLAAQRSYLPQGKGGKP